MSDTAMSLNVVVLRLARKQFRLASCRNPAEILAVGAESTTGRGPCVKATTRIVKGQQDLPGQTPQDP
jgi:hypothetical protein